MLKKIGKRLKDQRGLTLVELLAVVVILGIIAAIAVPSIGNIVAKSKFDAAKADSLQIIAAAAMADADGVDLSSAVTDLGTYLDITDKNVGSWSVLKTGGVIQLTVTFKHPDSTGSAKTYENRTRKQIADLKYKE